MKSCQDVNTIQWIGLESSEVEIFSFNENLSDQDRVICA